MTPQNGLTLIEIVIIIGIIGIVSAIIAPAFPAARSHQILASDTQVISAAITAAGRLSLNEDRPPECLDLIPDNPRPCSNLGVHIQNQTLTLFSDTDEDLEFSASDFVRQTYELKSNPHTNPTFVFTATPPTITLYANKQPLISQDTAYELTLAHDDITKTLHVRPYGLID